MEHFAGNVQASFYNLQAHCFFKFLGDLQYFGGRKGRKIKKNHKTFYYIVINNIAQNC